MKVPTKTSTEDVKVTNVFKDEYAPDKYEFICDDCLAGEVESLKEDVAGLAEDILDHDDILGMLGEKIQAVEDDQQQDVENLSNVVEILECMQKASRMLLDTVVAQNEQIKEFKSKHNSLAWITFANLVWLAVLTVLFGIYVF